MRWDSNWQLIAASSSDWVDESEVNGCRQSEGYYQWLVGEWGHSLQQRVQPQPCQPPRWDILGRHQHHDAPALN